ncbi:MAG: cobalamin biosynthesis protein CobD [Eggerthellaceae bacterium]|nr:cobalamin biosynthesis protein CobD [Eggerthellaceae bacterium]
MKFRSVIAMGAGFALDSVLGDPMGWPHPVRLIGKQIELEEGLVRKHVLGELDNAGDGWPLNREQTERLCGAAISADVMLAAPIATWALLRVCERFSPWLALGVESVLCYQLVAARSLRDESMKVHDALAAGDIPAARHACGMIVGRDTESLDESELAQAAVETVAENTSDGVVAPLLFMGLGGAPAAMLYKAVNTLDSMIGYKNDLYKNLGTAAAKIDDAFNFVPARVSGALMCAAAGLTGFDAARAWRIFKRDRLNHTSPNSAHTEAACAGALDVQLGGGHTYFGTYVDKPTIGDATRSIETADIVRANQLMYATAALGLGVAALIGLVRNQFPPR